MYGQTIEEADQIEVSLFIVQGHGALLVSPTFLHHCDDEGAVEAAITGSLEHEQVPLQFV